MRVALHGVGAALGDADPLDAHFIVALSSVCREYRTALRQHVLLAAALVARRRLYRHNSSLDRWDSRRTRALTDELEQRVQALVAGGAEVRVNAVLCADDFLAAMNQKVAELRAVVAPARANGLYLTAGVALLRFERKKYLSFRRNDHTVMDAWQEIGDSERLRLTRLGIARFGTAADLAAMEAGTVPLVVLSADIGRRRLLVDEEQWLASARCEAVTAAWHLLHPASP